MPFVPGAENIGMVIVAAPFWLTEGEMTVDPTVLVVSVCLFKGSGISAPCKYSTRIFIPTMSEYSLPQSEET